MGFRVAVACLAIALGAAQPALAEDVSVQIDAARAALGKGDNLHALSFLQAAVASLNARLSDQFAKVVPGAPAGWEAAAIESQSLDTIGGGITLTRAYTKGDSTLNAALIIDNPAVSASAAMFQAAPQVAAQPGWSRLKLGGEDALLRFDAAARSGEIMMVIGGRVLLQVEGTEIASDDVLVDVAKGWNTGGIRKLIAAGS